MKSIKELDNFRPGSQNEKPAFVEKSQQKEEAPLKSKRAANLLMSCESVVDYNLSDSSDDEGAANVSPPPMAEVKAAQPAPLAKSVSDATSIVTKVHGKTRGAFELEADKLGAIVNTPSVGDRLDTRSDLSSWKPMAATPLLTATPDPVEKAHRTQAAVDQERRSL